MTRSFTNRSCTPETAICNQTDGIQQINRSVQTSCETSKIDISTKKHSHLPSLEINNPTRGEEAPQSHSYFATELPGSFSSDSLRQTPRMANKINNHLQSLLPNSAKMPIKIKTKDESKNTFDLHHPFPEVSQSP